MKCMIFALLLILCNQSVAMADGTTVSIDLSDLPSNIRNGVVDSLNEKKTKAEESKKLQESVINKIDPAKIQSWANIGKELGQALGEMCKAINVGVNDFIRTPVGILATIVLIWKLAGVTIMSTFYGLIIVFLLIPLVWWSYTRLHLSDKIVTVDDKGNKTIEYVERHEFSDSDSKNWSIAIHVVVFIILVIIAACKF